MVCYVLPFFFFHHYQGLKNHAVTMFEVGKLTDEVLDSFLEELDKVTTNIKHISCSSTCTFLCI